MIDSLGLRRRNCAGVPARIRRLSACLLAVFATPTLFPFWEDGQISGPSDQHVQSSLVRIGTSPRTPRRASVPRSFSPPQRLLWRVGRVQIRVASYCVRSVNQPPALVDERARRARVYVVVSAWLLSSARRTARAGYPAERPPRERSERGLDGRGLSVGAVGSDCDRRLVGTRFRRRRARRGLSRSRFQFQLLI
jgi:hypothetical protein